jgi:hypothetical protein
VENRIVESEHGILVPLVNWTPDPVESLTVSIQPEAVPDGATAVLASGRDLPPGQTDGEGRIAFTFDLDVADAIIFSTQ